MSPETQERNRQRAYDYYWANREHCIQRATNNNKLKSSQLRADYTLKSLYGIECGWYQTTFEAQCGKCAICGRNNSGRSNSKRFCVDHNHITGEVRGLLCHLCNTGIGKLKDDISLLQSAIHYLQQYDKTIQN